MEKVFKINDRVRIKGTCLTGIIVGVDSNDKYRIKDIVNRKFNYDELTPDNDFYIGDKVIVNIDEKYIPDKYKIYLKKPSFIKEFNYSDNCVYILSFNDNNIPDLEISKYNISHYKEDEKI